MSRNLGPLLIILVVLVVAVAGYWIREDKWPGLPWNLGVAPTNFVLEDTANPGELIQGFPAGFIHIVSDASIKNSVRYSLNEGGKSYVVLTATYRTAAGIPDIFAGYVGYFSEHGLIVQSTESKGGLALVEAKDNDKEVSVSISLADYKTREVRVEVRLPVIQ